MPRWGDVLRVTPRWVPWAYWTLVALLIASAAFVVFGTVSSYSSGPAIVRSTANTPVAASAAGNVAAVDVSPGDAVEAGAVIARFDDADQRTAVARLEHEFQTQLRNHMLDPADAAADTALRAVRNELETARTRLDERLIRASKAGVISDVRVHVGQRVEPGDIVASLIDSTQRLELIALLPGEDRPQLAAGMQLRLELAGYRYAYQSVVIDQVSPDVISPSEARRILGAEVAENLELAGPVVLVRAWLSRSEFEIDGRTLRYHDGMRGTAEVRLRAERILFALVPGARRLL
jgi:membrane fusion protein (multidrug efflux system)